MKPQARHGSEDRLLELAYGELPEAEARALQEHLDDCPGCTESLRQLRSVRTAMAPLAREPVPDAGLDSLLAYARSAAQRNAQQAAPTRRGWRRFVLPTAGLAAASLFGVVVLRQHEALDVAEPAAVQQQRADKAELERYGAPAPAPAPPPPLDSRGEASRDEVPGGLPPRRRTSAIPPSKRALPVQKDEAAEPLAGSADSAARLEERRIAQAESEAMGERAPPREEGASGAVASSAPARSAPAAAATSAAGSAPQPMASAAAPASPAPAPQSRASRTEAKGAADPAALTRAAQVARSSGDRVREALLLREALAAGARDRAGLLRRLCEAELASGRSAEARQACEAVRAEAPGSPEARAAERLLEQLGPPSTPTR